MILNWNDSNIKVLEFLIKLPLGMIITFNCYTENKLYEGYK